MVIAFCLSLRARALANDWAYHTWLLERVVQSMFAQPQVEVQVVIGCHDVPDTPLRYDSRVQFLQLDVEIPQKNFEDMSVDKVIKNSAAARWVVSQGAADYIAFNDADDLVSGRLGGFIHSNRGTAGWYNAAQRMYTYGGHLMRSHAITGGFSGPCVVVRSDLVSFSRPPFSGLWVDLVLGGGEDRYLDYLSRHRREVCDLVAGGHEHYRAFMSGRGCPLQPLPFAANVVINHGDSMSTAGGRHGYPWLSSLGRLKRSLRWVPSLRLATPAVRREFQIPANSDIPDSYRRNGSVFWR